MSKSSRVARQRAQRAAAALRQDQARRRRMMWAGSAVGTVVVVVLVFVLVWAVGGGNQKTSPQQSAAPASSQLLQNLTQVPPALLDQVGLGKVDSLPKALPGQPALTANGKPLVLYVGAEYCPFCAGQRWGIVVALSRFGTFANLTTSHSAADDVYPNTPTVSFHGVTYTSQYVEFQGVETQTNVRKGNTYTPLDSLTAEQLKVVQTYNAPPYVPADSAGAIPFVDFGNKYLISGASVSPKLLVGMTPEQVAAALSDPNSPVAQAILGSANAFTAAICQLTGDQPANVCTSAGVMAYKGKLGAG